MKVLVIFSLLMVALLARSTKNYLIELEDKNETINEEENKHNIDENVDIGDNHAIINEGTWHNGTWFRKVFMLRLIHNKY